MWRTVSVVPLFVLLGCARPAPPPPPPSERTAIRKPAPRWENVTYPAGDKKVSAFLCHPAPEGPYPGVMMIPDRMGLTEGIKKQALRLAQDGYVVLAADLYRGEVPQTAKEAERRQRELPKERALGDLKAAVNYLSKRTDVRASTLGVIGFGLGGSYVLDAAVRDPRLHAVVICYSPLPSDPKPLESLKGSVLCILAGKDKSITTDTIEPFRKAMANAGKRLDAIRVYGACAHGFLDPADWPTYGEPSLEDVTDAWKLIAAYLDRELQ